MPRSRLALPLALPVLAALAGCGSDRPDLGEVTGVVKNAAGPVAGAAVEFHPEKGRPSYATSGDDGRYELAFTADAKGAVVGKHSVRVTPPAKPPVGKGPAREEVLESAAAKTLALPDAVEVKPGDNAVDIDLTKAKPLASGGGDREVLEAPVR